MDIVVKYSCIRSKSSAAQRRKKEGGYYEKTCIKSFGIDPCGSYGSIAQCL